MARGVFNVLGSADDGAFDRLRKNLNPDWIDEALEATGTATIRRRRLPAEQVIWPVLGMALYRQLPIDELVEHLDLVLPGTGKARVAKSAIAQARARLGDEPIKWLFERCSSKWGHESARRHEWRGLALYGVDGTTARVPDSEENRAHIGSQRGRNETLSGYPLARIVTLMALRSHIIVATSFGPYDDERAYAKSLWPQIPSNSLVLVDRNFLAANILLTYSAEQENRHFLTRAKSTSKWKVLKKLGRGDELVEFETSSEARKQNPDLPRTWTMRAIQYRRPGFLPQTLLTSLLDAEAFPADELRELYHERWDIELGYDEVETDMLEREETIRSRKPKGVMQELWAIGLAYNLIRLEMERIAAEVDLPPSRISFVASLRFIRDEWMWASLTRSPGTLPRKLVRLREQISRFVLPPRRSHRSFPRAVKLKMSNYDRKRPKVQRVPGKNKACGF